MPILFHLERCDLSAEQLHPLLSSSSILTHTGEFSCPYHGQCMITWKAKQHLDDLLQKLAGLIQSWADYWLSKLVLHPPIHLAYFEDTTKWDESVLAHTGTLLEHLYDVYKADNPTSDTPAPKAPSVATSIFLQVIQNLTPAEQRTIITEIETFFSGTYPCLNGDALNLWMVCVLFMTVAFMLLIVHLPATCSWFPSACLYCTL